MDEEMKLEEVNPELSIDDLQRKVDELTEALQNENEMNDQLEDEIDSLKRQIRRAARELHRIENAVPQEKRVKPHELPAYFLANKIHLQEKIEKAQVPAKHVLPYHSAPMDELFAMFSSSIDGLNEENYRKAHHKYGNTTFKKLYIFFFVTVKKIFNLRLSTQLHKIVKQKKYIPILISYQLLIFFKS